MYLLTLKEDSLIWLRSNSYFVEHVLSALDVDVNKLLLTWIEEFFNDLRLKHLHPHCLADLNQTKYYGLAHIGICVAHLLCQGSRKCL